MKLTKPILFTICLFIQSGDYIAQDQKNKKIKIAFFVNLLSVRGVEVSVYDYADCNETILGNESIIINNMEYFGKPEMAGFMSDYSESARVKFIKRFGPRFFDCNSMQQVEEILMRENADIFYHQKYGVIDDKVSKVCKNAVHAVFTAQIHGDAYACISEWLSNQHASLHIPYVPYMVRLNDTQESLHAELGIPKGSIVFGRHGGARTFSIDYAKEAIIEIAQAHRNWYFVFLNTDKFCNLPNVIFLPLTANMEYKTKFINTCDAMIHARADGETFGLACAEFSIKNKPIITCSNSGDQAHIAILSNKGLYYSNKQELINIVTSCGNNINIIKSQNWDAYSEKFSPIAVMKKFNEIFIQPLIQN